MKIFKLAFIGMALLTVNFSIAQYNRGHATVVAQNYDISDNLDLQAVASIFGESKDLEDFERRLNDPSVQISNLDLNGDNYVDYLRVLEVVEGDARIIIIQAVLGQDLFQDVATIELERQRDKTVHVQIVGNSYIYGPNYIYEPYYYTRPVFFDMFWLATYRPYYSPWYWGYYPTYYSYWRPMPVFRYHRHVHTYVNPRNKYRYTDSRRLVRADRMYSNVRGNAIERQNPNRSFVSRNENMPNRRALETTRSTRNSNLQTREGRNDRTTLRNNTNRAEGVSRSTSNEVSRNTRLSDTRQTSRERVSSQEFSRTRANNNNEVSRSTNNAVTPNRATSRNNRASNNSSTVTTQRQSAPVSNSNSRIERSSRISSQPSRSFSQPSRSNTNISRGSSTPTMRSSSPSTNRSSGASGGGRSSSSNSSRGGR